MDSDRTSRTLLLPTSICMTSIRPTSADELDTTLPTTISESKSLINDFYTFEDFPSKNHLIVESSNQNIGLGLLGPTCTDSKEIHDIGNPFETMGIENSWNDDNNFNAPPPGDYPIPLPPPGGFDDITCLDQDIQSSDHAPFHESDLGHLFSNEPETSEDVKERNEKIDSTGKESILDSSAVPGVCGLHNMGNTCFMGAGLQCLSATPALMDYFLNRPSYEKDSPHSLTEQFSSLLHKIWGGKFSVLGPDDFKQALGINHPQFKDYRQHDCQEFLALLLDNLHEQLNHASAKSILSDLSTAPPTPYSTCEVVDDRDFPRKLLGDTTDQDTNAQAMTSFDYLRCNQSSSSHSSDSSGESRNVFRLQPIPENVVPFKGKCNDSEEPMDVTDQSQSAAFASQSNVNGVEQDTFCNHVDKDSGSSNNLVTENQLKRDGHSQSASAEPVLDKNEMATQYNNASQCFRGFEDILKDAKTSNVNVLVTEQEINNEIRFDSEKFPKQEKVRRRDPLENPNLTEFHNFDGKTVSIKRIKDNNLLGSSLDSSSSAANCGEGSLELESSICFNNIKRMRLGDGEKNHRMEIERKLRGSDGDSPVQDLDAEEPTAAGSTTGVERPTHNANDDLEADKFWEKHLSANQSIVVDTFQGQFKSTVVCSACGHISVTYEPFMYLSVPVPHAMERQICVTVVPANSRDSVKYLLTLNKQDKILKLKEELFKVMGPDGPKSLVLAEVLDTHIARTLDESLHLRHVNDTNRSIYAFEMLPPPPSGCDLGAAGAALGAAGVEPMPLDLTPEADDDERMGMPTLAGGDASSPPPPPPPPGEDDAAPRRLTTSPVDDSGDGSDLMGPLTESEFEKLTAPAASSAGGGGGFVDRGDGWKTCAICLEDMDTDVRRHKSCSCILCEACIETSCKHYNPDGDKLSCPVCSQVVKPDTDFVPLDTDASTSGDYRPTVRILNVPVVFRLDADGGGNNNKKSARLFGRPHLVRLPSRIAGGDLYAAVDRLVPYAAPYDILLVDGQGYRCSRCMYTAHCRGCNVSPDGEARLQTGDTLAVRLYERAGVATARTVDHASMGGLRGGDPLSLYDCLQAFSKSEQLDEHNPWYCPTCKKNQCATKTLSVWRYPNFLIVYLKRFIFHDGVSVKLDNKITFPLTGLKFSSPSLASSHTYNLYSCVCHFGDSTAGHYTAYARHPASGDWHYFNDADVARQKPQEEHYNNGYVLFYQKQGTSYELPKLLMSDSCKPAYEMNGPKLLMSQDSSKPNIDQLILDLDSSVEQDRQQEILAHGSAS